MKIPFIIVSPILFVVLFHTNLFGKEKADIIVAKDGSGNYTTIQEAVNAVPSDNKHNIIILIRKGLYHEKIYLTKNFISLVGEDRDSTQIVYAELRKNWTADHHGTIWGSDWGSAVINIDSNVSDITLANLTVHNNYGSLYGDHDHQFAIRGGGTRVIILNCTVIADGGDTLSLWNKTEGMYYHANCSFEGWVDYVCPRGWCYITDSKFYGHNLSASIWHDGDANISQKFVIRYSAFDGVQGFPLGRHHRDGQMYLLNCSFSKAMADTPIYFPNTSKTSWKWGPRHYFYHCHRDEGDFDWFKDNLETASGSPKESTITASWTFDGRWDPEGTMPSVLPTVYLPRPRDASSRVQIDSVILRWVPARNADSHNVYFGKTHTPEFRKNQKENIFRCDTLEPGSRYYWRIDELIGTDTLRGPVWQFSTAQK